MNQISWQKIEELFHAALEVPADERNEFLEISCEGDEYLKNEVLSLLEGLDASDSVFGETVFSFGLALLEREKGRSLAGQKFGRYRIVKSLGEGGMGRVFLAQDPVLNRHVALKLLLEDLVKDDESVARFEREALAASAISHPNIAHIYEAGVENKQRFIAMEYVDGTNLRDLLKQKKMDLFEAVDIAGQIASALGAAHEAGIVHRDIKPENLMLRQDGFVKILDFGVAKLLEIQTKQPAEGGVNSRSVNTTSGLLLGTVGYISPEQLKKRPADFRTDLWSLGVVFYEMLAGRKPFEGETLEKTGRSILTKNPEELTFPSIRPEDEIRLKRIIARMLQKEPARRYQSAARLAAELKELKQNLEFNRQFSTGKISASKTFAASSETGEQPENLTFLIRTREFWRGASFSRKVLALGISVCLLAISATLSGRYFAPLLPPFSGQKAKTFSMDSRGNLQLSTLFSAKRKPNGEIAGLNFSPDGKSIAFALSGDDTGDIYVKAVERGEAVKITGGKWMNYAPLWSPDGQSIAFVSNRDHKFGIWTVSSKGGEPELRIPLENTGFACYLRKWSNDGKRIYYESCKKFYAIELDSGRSTEITLPEAEIEGGFNLSADEKMLALVTVENKRQRIFTFSLETGEFKAASKNEHQNWSPVFFPDKARIAYSSNQNGIGQIYVSDLMSAEESQITFGDINASFPVVSPDGSRILYVSQMDEANIFSLDISTGKESPETSNTRMQLFPDISSNNKMLIFQATDNQTKIYSSPLKIKTLGSNAEPDHINLEGGEARWSPANNAFAFLKQTGTDKNIWKSDAGTLKEKQLTFGGILVEGMTQAPFNLLSIPFDWSPDGKKIAYGSKQSGFYNLWTIDDDGLGAAMLTRNEDNKLRFSSPLWSRAGEQIAYVYRKQLEANKARYGIGVLSQGRTTNLFESDLPVRLLGWLPNERELLAATGTDVSVRLLKISTSGGGEPLAIANLEGVYLDGMKLSPDGDKTAYAARRDGISNIYLFSADRKESKLTSNLENTLYYSGIVWSRDGKGLYYSKQSGGMQISMISDPD